jgi:16S rRNA (adenine1518-N6/adenine1519-N6)-dimethyltransferase
MAGRRLGQHFLVRQSVLERIAAAACPLPDQPVIEIGPGKGALTQHLVRRAAQVHAIEVDQVLVHYLQEKFRNEPKFSVQHADVLKADLAQWGRVQVCGNLPYYITSPILERVLALGPNLLHAVFLIQKEVADRVVAAPGSRDYGYLSVQVQIYAEPKYLFTVPPDAFKPPPQVDSAVIALTPRVKPLTEDPKALVHFAGLCFRQKRKMLRNNLAGFFPNEAINAQPEARLRAEQLSVLQLADLRDRILKFQ